MITGIVSYPPGADAYTFNLEGADESGIVISQIDGLGPAAASLHMESVYNVDGSFPTGIQVGQRNITIDFILPGANPQEKRRLLYRAFPVKQRIRLDVRTEKRTYTIDGYVETLVPGIFAPQQTVQISMVCPRPYFRQVEGYAAAGVEFRAATSSFTFPISTPPDKMFGNLVKTGIVTVDYSGDAPTGALMRFVLADNPGTLSVTNHARGETWKLDFNIYKRVMGYTPGVGDTLEIDAREDNLYTVVWRQNGQRVLATGMVEFGSVWPTLYPGANPIEIATTYGNANTAFSKVDLMYSPLFMGV